MSCSIAARAPPKTVFKYRFRGFPTISVVGIGELLFVKQIEINTQKHVFFFLYVDTESKCNTHIWLFISESRRKRFHYCTRLITYIRWLLVSFQGYLQVFMLLSNTRLVSSCTQLIKPMLIIVMVFFLTFSSEVVRTIYWHVARKRENTPAGSICRHVWW